MNFYYKDSVHEIKVYITSPVIVTTWLYRLDFIIQLDQFE